MLSTILIPLSTIFTRISAAALTTPPPPIKCGAYLRAALIRVITVVGNLLSLLHLGQIVIRFKTLLRLGQNVITFRVVNQHLGLLLQHQENVFMNFLMELLDIRRHDV